MLGGVQYDWNHPENGVAFCLIQLGECMANKVILHIEDDASLANLVELTFKSFGFVGEILHVTLVEDAITLLSERELKKLPVNLILSDMHLPDGQGLDFLKHLKSSPIWSKTPVIILSGDNSQEKISEAYALGANCYFSKFPTEGRVVEHLHSLYHFWMQKTIIPQPLFSGGIKEAFCKANKLRARTAQFYIDLSKVSVAGPGQELFWLERAMTEGNLSNLLVFFEDLVNDENVPLDLSERMLIMQAKVEQALFRAEQAIKKLSIDEEFEINCSILGLIESWDEEVFVELFKLMFPMNPPALVALISRGAHQVKAIANYVINESDKNELIHRAQLIHEFSDRLERMSAGGHNVAT